MNWEQIINKASNAAKFIGENIKSGYDVVKDKVSKTVSENKEKNRQTYNNFGQQYYVDTNEPVNKIPMPPVQMNKQTPSPVSTPVPQEIQKIIPPTKTVENNYQKQNFPELESKISKAISIYGGENAPILKYSSQIAQATEKYQFLKDNPYLVPLIAHLETSSGRNITRPNNLLNWGINFPGNNEIFATMTPEQVLDKALSGLGERDSNYSKFRTGKPLTDEELLEFAKKYEPANDSYGPNLVNGRKFIMDQLEKGYLSKQ